MKVVIATMTLFSSLMGTALCSVMDRECPTDLDCPKLPSSCTGIYETGILFENKACPSCPVCIDTSVPEDEYGCPDRKEMCQETVPQNCRAERVFDYNEKTCYYCDIDICVNHSNTDFI